MSGDEADALCKNDEIFITYRKVAPFFFLFYYYDVSSFLPPSIHGGAFQRK